MPYNSKRTFKKINSVVANIYNLILHFQLVYSAIWLVNSPFIINSKINNKNLSSLDLNLNLDEEFEITQRLEVLIPNLNKIFKNFAIAYIESCENQKISSKKDSKGNIINRFGTKFVIYAEHTTIEKVKIDEKGMLEKIWEEIKNIKVDVQNTNSDMKNLNAQVQTMNTELQDVKKTVLSMDKRLTNVERDVKVLKEDVKVLKEDVKVLKEDVKVLKEDVKVLKEDVKVLKEDVADLKVRVTNIEKCPTIQKELSKNKF